MKIFYIRQNVEYRKGNPLYSYGHAPNDQLPPTPQYANKPSNIFTNQSASPLPTLTRKPAHPCHPRWKIVPINPPLGTKAQLPLSRPCARTQAKLAPINYAPAWLAAAHLRGQHGAAGHAAGHRRARRRTDGLRGEGPGSRGGDRRPGPDRLDRVLSGLFAQHRGHRRGTAPESRRLPSALRCC